MPPQSQTSSPTDNKQIVQRFMEDCWNNGKMDTLSNYVAENCRLHDPVFPNLTSGVQNLRTHIEGCRRAFPDLHFNIDDTIAERDEVVIHWTGTGTHNGDFLGMPPTGRKTSVSGTSIHKLEGGKIVEEWAHWNLMSMMEQLGIATPARTESTQPAEAGPR
jgi:steroid delta-isomerase-like uncharacterized protein